MLVQHIKGSAFDAKNWLFRLPSGVEQSNYDFQPALRCVLTTVHTPLSCCGCHLFSTSLRPLLKVAGLIEVFLKARKSDISSYDDAVSAMNQLRVSPEVTCIFLLTAVISTRQGPFAEMKGMSIKCPAQGYAVWKNVMMAALHRWVNVPGLIFLNPKSAAPESTATSKLIEFEGTLTRGGCQCRI